MWVSAGVAAAAGKGQGGERRVSLSVPHEDVNQGRQSRGIERADAGALTPLGLLWVAGMRSHN